MSLWYRTLDLTPEWGEDIENPKPEKVVALAGIIADRLEKLEFLGVEYLDLEEEKEELIEAFRDFNANQIDLISSFDSLMDDLYDWGDTRLNDSWPPLKLCWINTF